MPNISRNKFVLKINLLDLVIYFNLRLLVYCRV